jgi:hypothetical protein
VPVGLYTAFRVTTILTSLKSAVTMGGDGTSIRHIPYESRHLHYKAPSYTSGQNNSDDLTRKTRFLGVHSCVDQTAEQNVKDSKKIISNILATYERSPLAQRSKQFITLSDFFLMLHGMHSDHCTTMRKYS